VQSEKTPTLVEDRTAIVADVRGHWVHAPMAGQSDRIQQGCHRGELLIEKSASGGLSFWHADGTAYGGRPNTSEADVAAQTFRGLRNVGFGEREARDAVRAAGARVGNDVGVESLMRSALERLTRNTWEKAS
jgi:hypothetical protein